MSEARALGTTVDRAYTPPVTRVKTVRVIPPTIQPLTDIPAFSARPRRVAAYARVSTSSEEQLTSYEAQVKHYTEYIKSKENSDNWQFVDVYTDKGITGVSTKKREGFNLMIQDALAGRIDLIITKSVSRFARNTVDTLTAIRKLKEYGVEVYFEEQNIYTLDGKGEVLLTHHVQHCTGGKPQYFGKRDLGDAQALRGRQGDHALRTVHGLSPWQGRNAGGCGSGGGNRAHHLPKLSGGRDPGDDLQRTQSGQHSLSFPQKSAE